MNPWKSIALALTICALGCQSTNSVREELIPRGQDGGHADEEECPEEWTIDEYLDLGMASWFYGRIEKVEGFTGQYWTINEKGQEEYSNERCGNALQIAVVVHVRPERTSWDDVPSTIRVGIPYHDFTRRFIQVDLAQNGRDVIWEGGGVRYFPVGSRIGMSGVFDGEGMFRAWTPQIFGVDENRTIEDYRGPSCVNGSLDGQSADEIITRTQKANEEQPVTIVDHFPLASHCFQFDDEKNEQ